MRACALVHERGARIDAFRQTAWVCFIPFESAFHFSTSVFIHRDGSEFKNGVVTSHVNIDASQRDHREREAIFLSERKDESKCVNKWKAGDPSVAFEF